MVFSFFRPARFLRPGGVLHPARFLFSQATPVWPACLRAGLPGLPGSAHFGWFSRLLRNFTSRFDDDAPPLLASSLLLVSSPQLVPTTAPTSPITIGTSCFCWRHPADLAPLPPIAGQIVVTRARVGSQHPSPACLAEPSRHPRAGGVTFQRWCDLRPPRPSPARG